MDLVDMKKFIKYTIIGLVGIVVLAAIGVTLLVTIVNPNRFKPFIEKSVYESTGRKLTLGGDISWKLYPNLGVTVRDVSLSNPDGFKTPNLVALHSADVSVGLIPLLSNHVVVKTLAIEGLDLALIKQNGVNNWTFTPPASESSPAGAPDGSAPQPFQLEMKDFSLRDSNIHFDDFDSNQHYGIDKTNLIVDTEFGGVIKFDQAADKLELNKVKFNYNDLAVGKLKFDLQQLANPQYSGDVEFSTLKLNAILDQFKIAQVQRKDMRLLDNINFAGNLNGDKQNITVKDLSFNFADKLKGKTSVVVKDFAKPTYNGSLELDKFNLNQLLDSLNIAVAARKNKPLLNNVAISSDGFSGDVHNIRLKGLKVSAGDTMKAAFGTLQVQNFSNPNVSGDVSIPTFNLNQTLDGLGIAVAERKNKPLLNSFAFSGGFNATPNSANLSNVKLSAGGLVNASLSKLAVQNFSKPTVSGDISLPSFNLNKTLDGLGVAVAERKNKPLLNSFAFSGGFNATPTSASFSNVKTSFGSNLSATLGKLAIQDFANPKISGDINLPNFSLNNVMRQAGMTPPVLSNPKLLDNFALNSGFAATKNSLNLTGMRFKLANSNINGNLNLSSFAPVAFNENLTIDKIDVADFSDVSGYRVPMQQVKLSGNSSIASNLNFATLNGKQNIQIGDIRVQGVSLDKLVLQLNSTINNSGQGNDNVVKLLLNSAQVAQAVNNMKNEVQKYSKPGTRDLSQVTNLGTFNGNVAIVNGVINPSVFKLVGPSVSLNGSGSVNLVTKALNYQVSSQLLTNGINPIFKKLVFPSTVTGTINNPSASLDWGSIQQQLLKYMVENNKGQIQNVVKQQINNVLGNQQGNSQQQNTQQNQAVDAVSKGVTNALGKLFGGQ